MNRPALVRSPTSSPHPAPPPRAVFSRIADAGIAVFTYDAHGHGKSEPLKDSERCLVNRFDDLVRVCCVCVSRVG